MDAFIKTVLPIIEQVQQSGMTGFVLVGLVGVGLGLLLKGKGGSTWLGNLVFFPVRLFTDLLDIIHTKKFKYYGMILAVLGIETFFAFRAATVYYDVLHEHIPFTEMMIVCVIVFVAIFLCGYMVVTHEGDWDWRRRLTAVVVIVHDCVGTLWMNYIQPGSSTLAPVGADPFAISLKASLTFGMCAVTVIPFFMGFWAGELRPQMVQEQEQEVSEFTSAAIAKIKRRAVDRVLRLATHTDVVRLVQALPANEFTDFKSFVMPIIAPGVPHHLTQHEAHPTYEIEESEQPALSSKNAQTSPNGDAKNATEMLNSGDQSDANFDTKTGTEASDAGRQNDDHFDARSDDKTGDKNDVAVPENSRQNDTTFDDKVVATENDKTGDTSSDKDATEVATKTRQPKWRQPATKQASQTATRDEKIRHYATKHPGASLTKLATKFNVSERTIQRALSSDIAVSDQQQSDQSDANFVAKTSDQQATKVAANGRQSDANSGDKLDAKNGSPDATKLADLGRQNGDKLDDPLATKNGHDSNQEPNTGEMESIPFEEFNIAQQN